MHLFASANLFLPKETQRQKPSNFNARPVWMDVEKSFDTFDEPWVGWCLGPLGKIIAQFAWRIEISANRKIGCTNFLKQFLFHNALDRVIRCPIIAHP